MSDAAIGYTNLVTQAGTTVSFAGTATNIEEQLAYPIENVLDPDPSLLSKYQVEEDLTSSGQYYRVEFSTWNGSSYARTFPVRLVAALNVCLSDSDIAGIDYIKLRTLSSTRTVNANSQDWSPSDLVPIPGKPGFYNIYWLLDTEVDAGAIEFLFYILAENEITLGVGFLWASNAIVLDGTDKGFQYSAEDPSDVSRDEGKLNAHVRFPMLDASWSFSGVEYALTYGDTADHDAPNFYDLMMSQGVAQPLLLYKNRGSEHSIQRMSLYASLTEEPRITHAAGSLFNVSLRPRQIV